MDSAKHTYLIRFSGDVGTKKGQTLVNFRSRLRRNIEDALKTNGLDFKVLSTRGRIYVTAAGDVAPILQRVFGIQSFSRIETYPFSTLEDLLDQGERIFGDDVVGRTFAVRSRRSSVRDLVPFTTATLDRELGSRLYERSAGVDLGNPEFTASIELTRQGVHFFSDTVQGPGGLPIGCEGRALTLISGGIDSVVAAWLMAKRGLNQDFLFYNMGDREHFNQVLGVIRAFTDGWCWGTRPQLRVIDLRPWVHELREKTDPALWQVILKRLMIYGTEPILAASGTRAIVTGDALGQVSSQTLGNLAAIEAPATVPVLRPLLGFDKSEIIDRARAIGTFDLSKKIHEYCALHGKGPTTNAKPERLEAAEELLDIAGLQRAAADAWRIDLYSYEVPTATAEEASLATDRVPDEATVIDLRSPAAFSAWHYPGALRLGYVEALRAVEHIAKGPTYLVCCELEFKSADLAERLRAAGHPAFYFRGGTAALLDYAASHDLVEPASVAPVTRF